MIFNDFVEYDGWFDDAWNVMILFLKLYDMLAWMRECISEICFFFPFFHKSKKCWRSYAYAHVMNHWLWMTCYDFLFKLRRWCMHGCVDACVKFIIQKDELLMYAWLGMMYELFFYIFFENKFELIPISLLFQIHGIILLWFFFTFRNHFFGLISY